MINIKLQSRFDKKYSNNFPLILKESIVNLEENFIEGRLFSLSNSKGKFIGYGYFGKQNKGVGWILSFDKKQKINDTFFHNKINLAIDKRSDFFKNKSTNAFRLLNGEGDGIGGLTIDYFDGYLLINWYSKGIYSFKNIIFKFLNKKDFIKGIYQKKRFVLGGKCIQEDSFGCGKPVDFPIIIKENGVNFAINLNDGAMVGLFLDQREVRKSLMKRYSNHKNVLNTFSYTGAFSVCAAIGKSQKTTSIDLAKRSFPKTKEQFEINNITLENNEIIVEDVFNYFKFARRKEIKFDTIILDPPSFAQFKKKRFVASKDYKKLLIEAISIIKRNGVIIASTNSSLLEMRTFKLFVKEAFYDSKYDYKIIEEYSLPTDFPSLKEFPESNYLKILFIRVGNIQ